MPLPPCAVAMLDEQHGVASRRDLLEAGIEASRIDALLRRGHLERVGHGVYRRTGSGQNSKQEEFAAVLRCGPAARLTGARLLGHLGVQGFGTDDPFVVLVPTGRRITAGDLLIVVDLAPQRHRASYGGVPGTTPARTLVELAALGAGRTPGEQMSDPELLDAYDRMRWRGTVNTARLEAVVGDLPSHPGAKRWRDLLATTAAVLESGGERSLETALTEMDPPLEWQVWVAPDLRVDGLWRDLALVVEYQGGQTHDDQRDRVADAQRHERLRDLGYGVVVVDRHDLRDPTALKGRLVAARERRRRELDEMRAREA